MIRLKSKVGELNAALKSSNMGQKVLREQLRKFQSKQTEKKEYESRLAEAHEISEKSKFELKRCDALLRVSMLLYGR